MSFPDDEVDLSEVDIVDGDWLEVLCNPSVLLDLSRRGFNNLIVREDYFEEQEIVPELEEVLKSELELLISNSSEPLPRIISEQELLNRIGLKENPNARIQGPITRDMLLKRIGMTEEQLGYERRGNLK